VARIRTIKPSFWGDAKVAGLTRDERLLVIGLLSSADDQGRFMASTAAIAGHVFPHDELAPALIRRWRDAIAKAGLIELYRVDGREYGWFPNWTKHQKINRPQASGLPAPPGFTEPPPPLPPSDPPPDTEDDGNGSRSDSVNGSRNAHVPRGESFTGGRDRKGVSTYGDLGSSVPVGDARLLPLRAALDDVRLSVRWDKLPPAAADRIVWLVDAHGVPALVAAAQRAWQANDPPAFANAWLGAWDALPLPRPRLVERPCADHGLPAPCIGCAGDRKAAQ
jgi:hypothetical protein